MQLDDKTYDTLKWFTQFFLPAFIALYATVAGLWHIPYVEPVVGTLSALDVFLAKILNISAKNYEGDGTLYIYRGDEKDTYQMMLNDDIEHLGDKSSVMFKVKEGE